MQNPQATFEQPGLLIKFAIDEDKKSGWAVDPQFGKDHAAVFEFPEPVGAEGGVTFTLTLEFNGNNRHNIGRPRIAITKLNTQDVYEQPTAILDLVISQKLGRHTTLKLGAKNLLNPKFERTYGKNSDLLYSSYTRGRLFGLSLTHEF